jgi:rubrerythrin
MREERSMSAVAELEDLKQVQKELQSLKMKDEEMYEDFVELFKRNRSVGYKNICKMLMEESTPEELKGIE